MEPIVWSDQFLTGNDDIDFQHRYFANLINRIHAEISNREREVYQIRLLKELYRYAVFHFYSEENIRIKLGIANLKKHERLHQELLDGLSDRITRAIDHTDSCALILPYVREWFIVHTIDEDAADFIRFRKG